ETILNQRIAHRLSGEFLSDASHLLTIKCKQTFRRVAGLGPSLVVANTPRSKFATVRQAVLCRPRIGARYFDVGQRSPSGAVLLQDRSDVREHIEVELTVNVIGRIAIG